MSPDRQLRLLLAAIAAIEAEQQLVRAAEVLYDAAQGTDAEQLAHEVQDRAEQLRASVNALGRAIAPQATMAMEQVPAPGGGA